MLALAGLEISAKFCELLVPLEKPRRPFRDLGPTDCVPLLYSASSHTVTQQIIYNTYRIQ